MRRKIAVAFVAMVLLGLGGTTNAGPGGCTNAGYLIPAGFEQVTVSSASIGFTSTLAYPTGGLAADMATVDVETNAIRYRADGTAPTATVGSPVASGASFTVCGAPTIKAVRFIRQSSDATISVHFYRQN